MSTSERLNVRFWQRTIDRIHEIREVTKLNLVKQVDALANLWIGSTVEEREEAIAAAASRDSSATGRPVWSSTKAKLETIRAATQLEEPVQMDALVQRWLAAGMDDRRAAVAAIAETVESEGDGDEEATPVETRRRRVG